MSSTEQERRADILNTMYRTLDWRECYQQAVELAEERDRERLYQKTGLEFFAPKKATPPPSKSRKQNIS